ncbi:alpha/beta fold hydrolase [Roseobacter sp. EG26]|uniref:alpha/beta fold hydrolase n=1 Tax=Roseobacter sp. EG26 TaxID=3412477 RepID=UPI003CE59326
MSLVVEDTGDGFPIVLLHGLGGTSNTWQPLMTALGNMRAIRPDMPGSGRSALGSQRLSIAVMVEAVTQWLTDRGIETFHLVGHSMGTIVCQHIAARFPDRVKGLVLYGALTEPPQTAREGLLLRATHARKENLAGIADQIVQNTLAPSTHRENPAAVAFVRESVLRQTGDGYAANCEALSLAEAADWRKITASTLLVTGESDPVAPVSMGRLLSEKISGAKLEILPGCGHWTPLEKPEQSAVLLRGFLAEHPQ